MKLFSRKQHKGPEFFIEDPVEERFVAMMDLVKDLSRKDYNKIKDAMDLGYSAYQKVRNIDSDDESKSNVQANDFILHDEEDK